MNLQIAITGLSPLLMHSGALVDPLNPHARAVAEAAAYKKRAKTDEAEWGVRKAEWRGGLYYDDDLGVHVPAANLLASFRRGGVAYGKMGLKVLESVILTDVAYSLVFPDSDKTPEELWELGTYYDARPVKVGQARVIRTRPMFREWSLLVGCILDTEMLDLDVFRTILDRAGIAGRLGDGRLISFGRYKISAVAEVDQ